jgi:hypothetical protein
MTGRRYYFTTIGAWRRHAAHCAETHFVTVNASAGANRNGSIASRQAEATDDRAGVSVEQTQAKARLREQACATDDATQILALIDADEGAHLAIENDSEFETLPHPLARVPVSQRVGAALAQFGVAQGDDTFTVAEKLAHVNPLLRHRVF